MKRIFWLIVLISGIQVSAQNCICKYYQYVYWEAEAIDIFTFKNGETLKICPAIRYTFDNDKILF